MIAIGIDPDLNGAVAVVGDDDGVCVRLLGWHDVPTVQLKKGSTRREYVVPEMLWILRQLPADATVFLEMQHPLPRAMRGGIAAFTVGRGFGLWEGLLAACGLPYELVRASAWQRSMLAGRAGDTKAKSLGAAGALFPGLPLTKPRGRKATKTGRSDAALIALWGLRKMKGEAA